MPYPELPPGAVEAAKVVGSFLSVLVALLFGRYLLLSRLRSWAAGTTTRVDDLVLAAVHTPSLFWCVAFALKVGLSASPLDPSLRDVVTHAITVLVVVSMTLVAGHIAGGAVTQLLRRQTPDGRVPGLGQAIVRGPVFLVGAAVALNVMGVEITPLITALGVGGLAVALALQDTLTNFFAGLHILLERPYHIGHFIRLQDGQQGHVLDIGWRTTRVRTEEDDVIVVPNSVMAGSTILNFHMPIPRSRVAVKVGVDYASDADRVRDVLLDVATKAQPELPYMLADPGPSAIMVGFGESSLDFVLRFYIRDIALQHEALDEMNRRVLRRFRAEGIEIPFPVRTVHLKRD